MIFLSQYQTIQENYFYFSEATFSIFHKRGINHMVEKIHVRFSFIRIVNILFTSDPRAREKEQCELSEMKSVKKP